LITSGIPDPHAYGANILTSVAAKEAKNIAHITYIKYEIIYAPAPSLKFWPPKTSDHVNHYKKNTKYTTVNNFTPTTNP